MVLLRRCLDDSRTNPSLVIRLASRLARLDSLDSLFRVGPSWTDSTRLDSTRRNTRQTVTDLRTPHTKKSLPRHPAVDTSTP